MRHSFDLMQASTRAYMASSIPTSLVTSDGIDRLRKRNQHWLLSVQLNIKEALHIGCEKSSINKQVNHVNLSLSF